MQGLLQRETDFQTQKGETKYMAKIAVVGLGYVGLSNAVILAQSHQVTAVDILPQRVELLNRKIAPIVDKELQEYLSEKDLTLTATTKAEEAYSDAEYVVIATPTDYDPERNFFDTSSIESVIEQVLSINKNATIVIKSTIPVGYTDSVLEKYQLDSLLFAPEFLREGHALYDNLYPSRIIVGIPVGKFHELEEKAKVFAGFLQDGAKKKDIPTIIMKSTEAEAVKLFSNTFLAMRVAYFNELDTYAEMKGLDSSVLIQGVSLDPRIGMHYNNPSFGYGGYCLPKDTKQLLANYAGVPNELIGAIVKSNSTRKQYITERIQNICKKTGGSKPVVGIYRLTMKSGSDNFRNAAIIDIVHNLQKENTEVIVYEPSAQSDEVFGLRVIRNLLEFKNVCDCIVANRFNAELEDVKEKVYTRDVFYRD